MLVRRLPNPFRDLKREHKIMLGIAGGVVLATATIATVAWASGADPEPLKRAIEVGPGCTSYSILSEQQLRDDLRGRLRIAAKTGPIDPLQVTARYIRSEAPRCPTYPGNTETPGQVKLFAEIYLELLEVMQEEDFLSPTDFPIWYQMMTTWAAGQGVAIEDL